MYGGKCTSFWKLANRVGIFFVLLFVVCYIWYFVRGAEADLHMRLLRLAFFGYNDMGVMSFVLGAVQRYVWAYIFVGLWWLASRCCMSKKEMMLKREMMGKEEM